MRRSTHWQSYPSLGAQRAGNHVGIGGRGRAAHTKVPDALALSSGWRAGRILRAFRIFRAVQGLQSLILTLGRSLIRVARTGRILRAFRIFRAAQGLQQLIRTLGRSLKDVINLGVLLILLFFVTGIVTVQLFGRLCLDDFRLDAGPVSRLPDLTPWFNARSNIRFDPRSNSRSSVWSQRPV